jgi:outer membrane immunogenic protein
MRRAFAVAFCAVCCAAAGSARAGDLAVPAASPEPAAVAVPGYNWYGFFIGGHLGGGWSDEAVVISPTTNAEKSLGIAGSIAANPSGFLGGIQYGTNWQFQRIVLGTESDFSFTGIDKSQSLNSITVPVVASTGEQKLTWFGTTRVRAGYTVQDNVLVYGTVGLANGHAEESFSAVQRPGGCGAGAPCVHGSDDKTLWGWAIGAGVEYGTGPWSAKVEYLHYDLGTFTFYAPDRNNRPGAVAVSTKFAGDMVRAGVNYRFNWTPWQLIFGH